MARRFIVRGVVQGVGFRPFVYRLAHVYGLTGWVVNSSRGDVIEVEGDAGALGAFERDLVVDAPVLARIESVESEDVDEETVALGDSARFEIRSSEHEPAESTLICPDVAVCPDCLGEFLDAADRRHRYPFINCTNCGPRFSIIEETPYDRPKTSMRSFQMCPDCQSEYDNPLDRRFHAQPNACPVCGPALELVLPSHVPGALAETVLGRSYVRMPDEVANAQADGSTADPAAATRWLLKRDAIVGVRGLGGFHIAADATSDTAVRALREKKDRPAKPFAIMCRDIEVARELAHVGPDEETALTSPWSPVVLLRKRNAGGRISEHVAPANAYLGIMLPYAPLHHLLFDDELKSLVMTSANRSGEPIVDTVVSALDGLPGITRTFLTHDREIVNRSDDSVVFVEAGRVMMSRRSRGYAPYPITLGRETADVLACGTELKNTFALLKDGRAFVSQHIGDLENQATLDFYEEMVGKFLGWFRFDPAVVAHDLHPDYLATRFAKNYVAGRGGGAPVVGVQHHHAHIASVMVENRVDDPVIGVALDGTGYGTDGTIWGGEFIVADLRDFERVGHIRCVPLPGGDAAIRHPYRVALSHLHAAGVADLHGAARALFSDVPPAELELVLQQVEKGVNCIDTSSAGRFFDAASAILGVCHEISYEAQAAIELESLAVGGGAAGGAAAEPYPYDIADDDGTLVVDPSRTILALLESAAAGDPVERAASQFHETVVAFCREACGRIATARGIGTVALSGGVFQNRLLLLRLTEALTGDGLTVLVNREVPTNDGGVSLGQAIIASERARAGAL
jgi:hydrogenase maturation protein HypF